MLVPHIAPVPLTLQPIDDALAVASTTTADAQRSVEALLSCFGADIMAATLASLGVSPVVTIIDRAIAENASGKRTLDHAMKQVSISMVTHPIQFFKSPEFAWIFGIYAATYATANTIESYYSWKQQDGAMPKLAGTTLVNMTGVIAKDRAFAQMFGVIKPRPFPLASIGLFAIRDGITVVSCFHAPKVIMEKLEKYGMDENATGLIAQIGAPVAVQLLSTPLHLLGLDLYNHPKAERATRLQFIQCEYWRSSVARIARIGPAFGIGGIGNKAIRARLVETDDRVAYES